MADKITWLKYATEHTLPKMAEQGWVVSSSYGNRGGNDCYLMIWPHDGSPPEEALESPVSSVLG